MSEEIYKVLTVNPGSTSTKIAVYENEEEILSTTIEYSAEELEDYKQVADQLSMRKKDILNFLEEESFDIKELAAVVGRGGILPPVKAGGYRVNKEMVERLAHNPVVEHASNLGALISNEIAEPLDVPAYIYDSVAVDEMEDVARVSGFPELPRYSNTHTLNSRAMAMKMAQSMDSSYEDLNLIVAHLGGGISVNVHQKGKMIDVIPDDEGPFSPERAGRVPARALAELCYSGKYDRATMKKLLRGKGGLVAYLGTTDVREILKRIEAGDQEAELVLKAMAYQVAKGIGEMATVVKGDVDRIIITGGIAYSEVVTGWIKERVEFIAPVDVLAGENELESLALGTLRILTGEEDAREYTE